MIVAKTPLRIPLAGGLTDLPGYARAFGGVTVSTTIDKYVYVMLKENLGGYHRLRYQDVTEKVFDADHIKNDLIRESLRIGRNSPAHLQSGRAAPYRNGGFLRVSGGRASGTRA